MIIAPTPSTKQMYTCSSAGSGVPCSFVAAMYEQACQLRGCESASVAALLGTCHLRRIAVVEPQQLPQGGHACALAAAAADFKALLCLRTVLTALQAA